jgi:hypothetical protein
MTEPLDPLERAIVVAIREALRLRRDREAGRRKMADVRKSAA